MGIDPKKAPPLPAPTETESTTATELATDVSKPTDEKSSYSLPEDGTPVTIKTRSHKANRSQTSLLIEYFEGGKSGASGATDRKPSVRVRLTPSKKSKDDRIQITESKGSRKVSASRRVPVTPSAPSGAPSEFIEGEDAKSISSYASATEESNVSRNPIEVEIDRSGRRRRPASPLIPSVDSKAAYQSGNMSDISAIPTDSFLDGSGPTRTSDKRSGSPYRSDRIKAPKIRTPSGERVKVGDKIKEKDRKQRSKSRTSSGEKHADPGKSPRRRTSRGHQESVVSGADSSILSSNLSISHKSLDQHSIRSGTSRSSINNPKLLETVEDAIRRLILPELSALKREQSKREARSASLTSTGTSVSREELSLDRRRSSDKARESLRSKGRRDRESRHEYADGSPHSHGHESYESSAHDVEVHTPGRSADRLKAAAAGAAIGLAAASLNDAMSPDEKKQRRRRRTDALRSRSRGSDRVAEEYDDDHLTPVPPLPLMPLMSEINPSEMTRTSILSADTDRPHSATEELTPVHEVNRRVPSVDSTPTPTRTPISLQQTLGTQHANISHGDLKALPRKGTGVGADEFRTDERGNRVPFQARVGLEEEEYDEAEPEAASERHLPESGFEHDYYNTQDLPSHLKYVPYQPERRGLSPIYSVSGYTEGGSEAQPQRDSRVTHTTSESYSESPEKSPRHESPMHSPGSVPSNVMSREFDQRSDRSLRSSGFDYSTTMHRDEDDLDHVTSGQAVRGVGANPNIVHVPFGVESNVASLVDGSMLEQSVLSGYGPRDSMISYDDRSGTKSGGRNVSPEKTPADDRRDRILEEEVSPMSRHTQESPEFEDEYDIDEYGRKIPRSRYRESPTSSEAAITAGAVGAAAKALKAKQATTEDGADGGFVPAGVSRNKSFKERTLEGRKPANTPSHSVDRLEFDDKPRLGASGIPDLEDPMPEIGYVDDADTQTNPSLVEGRLDGDDRGRVHQWHGKHAAKHQEAGPREFANDAGDNMGLGINDMAVATALGTAVAMAASHSRQPSQEQEEEWHRTSDEKKRDTLVTNPFEDTSPLANARLADTLLGDPGAFGGSYQGRNAPQHKDEGYISQGPNRTPDFGTRDNGLDFPNPTGFDGIDDPFYEPKGHTGHLSGMSHGMSTPFYDPATGGGIENIQSKDIIALMQDLVARDAQRTARDTEIAATVMFLANEMRSSFRHVEDRIRKTEGAVVDEIQDSEKAVIKAIGGPRPYPGSAARSVQGESQAENAKKGNIIRRALKGLRATGTNDLTRIEEMLLQLLDEVDVLKAQTAQGKAASPGEQSLENLQVTTENEQDRGYEPEGQAGTSTVSQASQSGHLSIPQSRGASAKMGYDRRYSDHRISTVPEERVEEEYDDPNVSGQHNDHSLLTPGPHSAQRGTSVPLTSPPDPPIAAHVGSLSNENTPRTDKGKKHKSSSSTGWIPKMSRWSETTASSVSKVFRGSGAVRKEREQQRLSHQLSRSGSDLAAYQDDSPPTDPYGEDRLHSGHSDTDLPAASQPLGIMPPLPATYMTPEDPKYKAHRNSLNLQHPQPRPGQTERFKAALESQAQSYDSPTSPRSADWAGSATSLHRFPPHSHSRYSDGSGHVAGEYWNSSPGCGASSGPPRPPKEPIDDSHSNASPAKASRLSKLQKGSPLPFQSVESGYGTLSGTHASYAGSPKPENRNLSGALGVPTRRPSGPRAMTPKSAEEDASREERRRKRDTFGTVASQDTDTF